MLLEKTVYDSSPLASSSSNEDYHKIEQQNIEVKNTLVKIVWFSVPFRTFAISLALIGRIEHPQSLSVTAEQFLVYIFFS